MVQGGERRDVSEFRRSARDLQFGRQGGQVHRIQRRRRGLPRGDGDPLQSAEALYSARVHSFRIRALERESEERQMKVKEFDPASAERAWQAFRNSIGIAAIQTPRQYDQTVAFMNQLLDLVGENERHPLAGLLDLVGELVAAYESRTHAVPDVPPREVLRLLMEQNGLTQTDLHREVGGKPVLGDDLHGKR